MLDDNGYLWVGSENHGLSVFTFVAHYDTLHNWLKTGDRHTNFMVKGPEEYFRLLPMYEKNSSGIIFPEVKLPNGNIWYFSDDGILVLEIRTVLSDMSDELAVFRTITTSNGLKDNNSYRLMADPAHPLENTVFFTECLLWILFFLN